jgi:hypothetical protein
VAKDEKVIALINWKRTQEAEAARQAAIIQSMQTGCLTVDGVTIKFAEQTILEGRLQVDLPDNFTIMSAETARLKYPLESRPGLIFTDPNGTVNITFSHSPAALADVEVENFTNKMIRTIEKMQPDVRWQENGLKEVNGKKVGFCDFVVPAMDDDIYNLMFFMELNERVLIGAINCPVALMHNWKPIALGIVNSLRTNSGAAEPRPRNQAQDFTNYQFKSGLYTNYNNKEYRLFKLEDGNYRMISFDPADLTNGFEKKDGVYKKTVSGSEISTMCQLKTKVVYQGRQFELGEAQKNEVMIILKDCSVILAKQFELQKIGPNGEYGRWVTKNQIEDVWEEKVTV